MRRILLDGVLRVPSVIWISAKWWRTLRITNFSYRCSACKDKWMATDLLSQSNGPVHLSAAVYMKVSSGVLFSFTFSRQEEHCQVTCEAASQASTCCCWIPALQTGSFYPRRLFIRGRETCSSNTWVSHFPLTWCFMAGSTFCCCCYLCFGLSHRGICLRL